MVELVHLGRYITEEMLIHHFSQWARIDECAIDERYDERCHGNTRYATVCFFSMSEVDAVMEARPHILGGFRLHVRRHVNAERPEEKQKCTEVVVKQLLLSHTQQMLEEYFSFFGEIVKV